MIKKNKLINLGIGISICTLIGIGILSYDSSVLELNKDENILKWDFNKDYSMKNKKFQLCLNDEVILTTNDYEYDNYKKIDLVSPVEVSGYKHDYDENGVTVTWNKVDDIGTLNNYVLNVINDKNKSIKKSNTITEEYVSGFKTFKVYLNDNLIEETKETSVLINKEDLIEGVNTIKVEALDNEDNTSSSSYEFVYYKLDYKIENNILYPLNNDSSQTYNYQLKIEGNEETYEFTDKFDISQLFLDKVAPSQPSVTYSIKNNNLLCLNYSSEDNSSDYSYSISGVGATLNNKVYSEKLSYSNKQGFKGFYYYFGDSADYNVTDKDTFTDKNYIEIPNLEYKTYYLHIVAVDNAGNISEKAKYKIENKKPVVSNQQYTNNQSTNSQQSLPVDEKMNLINSICSKTSSVTTSQYNNRLNKIYNYIPTKVLTDIKNDGLKLKYITGNLRQYLLNNVGMDTGMEIWGIYRVATVEIYVTTEADIKSTIHEIGHAWDYSTVGYTKSYLNDFYNIYLEEKNQMFGANNYFAQDETEYFAECFATYLMNPNQLKAKAPKTYEYFKQNL